MSRTPVLFATVALMLGAATPGLAQTAAASAQPVAPQPAPIAPRAPADAQARAAADRMDPLARSVFWTRELEINAADPVAGVRLAQALREMNQFDQAAQTAQAVLVTQPNNVEAMLELGRAHIARGQAFYGVAALEAARDAAPRDWRPLSLLGVAYRQVRRVEDSREAWNAALRLSPDNPVVLTNAGMALATDGDAASAEILLRRAVAQPGASLQMQLNLAMVLGLQDKIGEAEQVLRRHLPPEAADRNLAWLRQRGAQTASVPGATPAGHAASSTARTWDSLQGG